MTAPITAAATNSMARNNKALPKKTVAKKRSSCCPSRSRSTPINHKKATPANGMRFSASATVLAFEASQAPDSNGSAGTERRSSQKIFYQQMVNTEPSGMVIYRGRDVGKLVPLVDPVVDEINTSSSARRYGISTFEMRQRNEEAKSCSKSQKRL